MGSFMRKRISKRSTDSTEVKNEVSSTADNLSKFLATEDHMRKPDTVNEGTMEVTPPPPPPSVLPRKPEKSLCSPSKSLLHRFQNRNSTENSTTGSPSSKKLAMTSPVHPNVTTRLRSKVPSFTENFEHSNPATELTIPPKVVSTTSINSATQTVGGVEFEMINSLQPPPGQPIRSKSAEPARGRSDSANAENGDSLQFRRKRESRSETREFRADSTIGDYNDDNINVKGATAEAVSLKTEKPRLKSILKKKENSNPVIEPKPKIPRVTRSAAAADPAKNTNTTTTKQSVKLVESSSDSSDSSDCEFILDNENRPAPNAPQKPEHQI